MSNWKDKGLAALNLLVVPWLARKAWGYLRKRKTKGLIKVLDQALSGDPRCPPEVAQAVDVLKRAQLAAAKAELIAARVELADRAAILRSKAKKK